MDSVVQFTMNCIVVWFILKGTVSFYFALEKFLDFYFHQPVNLFFAVTAFEKCLKKAHTCVCVWWRGRYWVQFFLFIFYNSLRFPYCFCVDHLRNTLQRGDSVTDSKFQLRDCSHLLVSEKPGKLCYQKFTLLVWCHKLC